MVVIFEKSIDLDKTLEHWKKEEFWLERHLLYLFLFNDIVNRKEIGISIGIESAGYNFQRFIARVIRLQFIIETDITTEKSLKDSKYINLIESNIKQQLLFLGNSQTKNPNFMNQKFYYLNPKYKDKVKELFKWEYPNGLENGNQ